MNWLHEALAKYPELAVYLALGIGFWVGNLKIRGFRMTSGKIKTHKLGKHKTGTRAVLGALAGVLSGGEAVLGGAVVGAF